MIVKAYKNRIELVNFLVVSRHTYTVSSGGKSVMDADPAPPAYYEALLMGALIVNADWAQKCSESGSLVEETNYQVK